jgi:lysophospholipase L1-like esterase
MKQNIIRVFRGLVCACCFAALPVLASAQPFSAASPSERGDAKSKVVHQQLLEKAKKGGIDLYFLGDSITRRWGCTDPDWAVNMENWKKNFFGWNAGNFGWGADSIQNILWRVKNGELDGVNPKVIVILGGTNNVGDRPGDENKIADIVKGIQAVVDTCKEKAPKAKIIVMGITPRNGKGNTTEVIPEIKEINKRVAKMADDKTVYYLDINDKLADADGKLFEGMTIDNLHLSVKGYQVWADALKPLLTKFLGKPAKTDHAPAPTGDPSVADPSLR